MMIVLKSTTLIHKKAPAEAGAYKTTAYSLVVKRSFRVDLYASKVHIFSFTIHPLGDQYKTQQAYA